MLNVRIEEQRAEVKLFHTLAVFPREAARYRLAAVPRIPVDET
jgi:hypothetical protein